VGRFLTRGHPAATAAVGAMVAGLARIDGRRGVGIVETDGAGGNAHLLQHGDQFLADPGFVRNDFLATYFSRATVLEHLCALLMTDTTSLYTLSGIHSALRRLGLQPTLGEVDEALGRLVDLRDILFRTDEGYRFAVPAIPAVIAGIRQLDDLVSLRREIYLREGDIEPELAGDDLRGRLW
jgi:hypothetical protein